jgi:tetratricopeptide (TPR) repeat protein
MKARLLFAGLVLAYALLITPFTSYMKDRPMEVKLGYLPHPQILRAIAGEHRPSVAGFVMMRVLFYFGTIIEKLRENIIIQPEFLNMYKTLQGIVHIDPRNADVYYFVQASYTWELGRINEVNHLLKLGMDVRPNDFWLPFYLGFNYAYFLQDYQSAAPYMQRAAELSGNPLFANLAARYFYESQQTSFGLAFLETMIQNSRDKSVKKSYEMRRDALMAVETINQAIEAYKLSFGVMPKSLTDLVLRRFLHELPRDPYGGTFYLDEQGSVRTTSKFSQVFGGQQ